jgi:tripartite motif-containing protein 71
VKKLLVALGIAALSTGAMAQSWEFEKTVGIGIGAAFTDPNGNYYYRSADASVTKADYNGNILSVWGAGILSGGGQGTFGRDGNIYIKDNNVVRKFDANGNFLMNIGQGQFGGAGSLATNSRGELYVADEYAHKIRVYKTDGTFVREFGSFGTAGQGTFAWPSGITIDKNDRVFIVENAIPYTTERVQAFDSDGNFLFQFGKEGSGPGEFQSPDQITTDSDGWVYVGEHWGQRVSVFDNNGNFINTIGNGAGSGPGQFSLAGVVAVLDDKTVLVDNIYNNRLDRFKYINPNAGSAVPEPSEWAVMGLLGAGLLGLVVRGRKKNLEAAK